MKVIATRKIDELGRIVLPVELRREWNLDAGHTVDISREDDGSIHISPAHPFCAVCHADDRLIAVKGAHICEDCLRAAADG